MKNYFSLSSNLSNRILIGVIRDFFFLEISLKLLDMNGDLLLLDGHPIQDKGGRR